MKICDVVGCSCGVDRERFRWAFDLLVVACADSAPFDGVLGPVWLDCWLDCCSSASCGELVALVLRLFAFCGFYLGSCLFNGLPAVSEAASSSARFARSGGICGCAYCLEILGLGKF